MGFFGRLKKAVGVLFDNTPPQAVSDETLPRPYQDSTVIDTFAGSMYSSGLNEGIVPRQFKYVKLDERIFKRFGYRNLLQLLKYNHPDVSQAVWNFKIIGNTGYTAKVTLLDGKSEHKAGQQAVDKFLRNLDFYASDRFEKTRGMNKLIDEFVDMILMRGAMSCELVMDKDLEDALFIAPVDPDTITFEVEKGRLVPYQWSITQMDVPTFFHEGLDETVVDPYGTTPFLSIIQTLAFQLQVQEDLKAVIHNQGYGKYDIKIIEEVLLRRMPVNIRNNEKAKQQWLNTRLQEIITMYSKLDPDAAFVHFDSVEVDMVENGTAMFDPQGVMAVIDTQVLGALKQYSTLMGRRSTGQTEQYAKLEIKIFMKSVQRITALIENVMSRLLTKYLNIQGMQGFVFFKFNDTEIRTELEKVNFEQIAITNARAKRDNGWISQDQASEEITGQKAVGQPDKEMLGVTKPQPQGSLDERQPGNPQSSDSTSNS